MALRKKICQHLERVEINYSMENAFCEECIEMGDQWVHLRMCVECGHIACCDSSKNQHARKHFQEDRHPVIVSAEVGENWAWCYEDEIFLKLES